MKKTLLYIAAWMLSGLPGFGWQYAYFYRCYGDTSYVWQLIMAAILGPCYSIGVGLFLWSGSLQGYQGWLLPWMR